MLLTKFLGLTCSFISVIIWGNLKYDKYKCRKDYLEDYYKFVMDINTQISYFRKSIPDILNELSSSSYYSKYVKYFCFSMYINLQNNNKSFEYLWRESINSTYSTIFNSDELETLYLYGDFLGKSDVDSLENNLSYCNDKLCKLIENANLELKEKGLMYRKSSVALGFVLVIILI